MTGKELTFDPFRLDRVNQCLWRGAEQISLSPKAFSVLLYLAERPARLVTKQELLDAVWPDIHVTEGVLKRSVLEIRKALGDPVEEPRFIQTLHRRGYRFLPAVGQQARPKEKVPATPGIVGREREFHLLDQYFGEALESARQIVFIAGEAGLGKTTLVDEWMRCVRTSQPSGEVAIARGRCLQQFGSGEPYLPVFEALDQLSKVLGRRLVEVLRTRAPTWMLHMPALVSLEDRGKLRDEVFGSTRERMLREITDALEALSEETPLVIALEDLHWSDPSTIDLLSSVARRGSPARLMILATYRPADAGGGGAHLLAAQNELGLHRQCQNLELQYLSEDETDEYVRRRFPGLQSPAALSAALHRRTNGNPLYISCLVEELARTGWMDADPESIRGLVPDTLQQMFERQAAQLAEPEQEMLDAAAVAGESFPVATVAAALGRDVTEMESACEALVKRQMILKRAHPVRFPDGTESSRYSFVHALCRDALYRRISLGRRSRLHGLLGRAEESLYVSDLKRAAAQLAGHFELAGDFPNAIRYLRTAAAGAAERYSQQEAGGYLERAFSLIGRLREEDQTSCRMDLLEQRAYMRLVASDMPAAAKDFSDLAVEAREAGAVDRRVKALLETVPPLVFVDYRKAAEAIEEARAAAAGSPDPLLRAFVDAYHAFFNMFLHGWDEELSSQMNNALPKLRSVADLRLRGRFGSMEAAMQVYGSEYSAARETAETSRHHCRKAGAFFDYYVATLYLNWALVERGDLGYAVRIVKDACDLAAKNGSALPLLWLTVRRIWVQMEAFDFEEAHALSEHWAADKRIAGFKQTSPFYLWVAKARLGVGDYGGAWEALERLRAAFEGGGVAFQVYCPMLHGFAECALGRQDLAGAEAQATRLVEAATEHRDLANTARGHLLLAEIAGRREDHESAAAHLAQALAVLSRCESWIVEWRVHAAAARVFTKLGRHSEASQSHERGLSVAQRVAATLAGEPALQQSFVKRVGQELTTNELGTATAT